MNDLPRRRRREAASPAASGRDLELLRHAINLSAESRRLGRHPFAALVVDADGLTVAVAFNSSVPPRGNPTQHAELVVAAMASEKLPPERLAGCTLYSSAEPCCMCAGAIYWCGIGRVVYALSERRLLELTGAHPENPTLALPCRNVFSAGQRSTQVVGPLLEAEAAEQHIGFWSVATSGTAIAETPNDSTA
jgi:tRNA(Arg) A34 adenosine deaminase TadA